MFSVLIISLTGFSQNIDAKSPITSNYLTLDTNEQQIDSNAHWNISSDDVLTINLLNSDLLTVEQYRAVEYVITSMDSIELNDKFLNKNDNSNSIYYLGWAGALNEAQKIIQHT